MICLLSGNVHVRFTSCRTLVNTPINKKTNQLRMLLILYPTNFAFFPAIVENSVLARI